MNAVNLVTGQPTRPTLTLGEHLGRLLFAGTNGYADLPGKRDARRILANLRNAGVLGEDMADVCRELQVTEATYYRWRNQFGGLKADDAKRLKDLERENSTLKRLLADAELEKAALKEIAKGNF